MEVTDLSVQLVRWPQAEGPDSTLGFVKVETNEGVVGHSFLGTTWRGAHFDTPFLMEIIKPIVLGRNPLDYGAIWQEMRHARRDYSIRAIGSVNVALLDIAGKVAGLPVFRLLGAYRDHLPAYASTGGLTSPEAFAEEALEYQGAGWPAYKIHPPRIPSTDVDVATAVRLAVGDNFKLMFDPVSAYSYHDALRVGLELQDLNYEWFEDPMNDSNIYGYRNLCAKLKIPVMATEYAPGGFEAMHQWLMSEATDILRADVTVKGGITPVMKIAHLAEAFHMNCELHHGGNALANVANLHAAGAIANCDYYEVVINDESRNFGLIDPPEVNANGNVRIPEQPGLGVEIDFDLLNHHSIQTLK